MKKKINAKMARWKRGIVKALIFFSGKFNNIICMHDGSTNLFDSTLV